MKMHKPIKRDKALVSLSKDHHFSLLLVWKIRQDIAANVDSKHISSYVLDFFRDDLYAHFKEEEEIVFSKLPGNDALRIQAEKEHKNICLLVDSLQENDNDKGLQNQFADLLELHVKFEERILFNHLQQTLKPEVLEKIFVEIAARESSPKRRVFFSLKNK